MRKIVFSSTLKKADWNNTEIVRSDAAEEVSKLKQQNGGNLLIWGHTKFARSLFNKRLVDILDLSIHPVIVGHGVRVVLSRKRNRDLAVRTYPHTIARFE